MPLIADLKTELLDEQTLKYITSTFTEINSLKAKKIRAEFEKNQRFFEEIAQVYRLVKEVAINKGVLPKTILFEGYAERKEGEKDTLAIAVTSNMRFYGKLNLNVARRFLEETGHAKTKDLMVIGQTGAEYLRAKKGGARIKTFFFKRDFPSRAEMLSLIDATRSYKRIYFYYPRFVTMVRQTVGLLDVTQTPTEIPPEVGRIEYIFEPELKKILDFFERHVRLLLLSRVMLEAELSRTAARLMTMSAANDRADELIGVTASQLSKATKSFTNARLLETFAGMKSWKKEPK